MANRHYKIIATVVGGTSGAFYRSAIFKRSHKPRNITWNDALGYFSINRPDDWNTYSYGLISQARASLGPRVKKLGEGVDVDPDIIRITVDPARRTVRMDS